MREMSMSRRTRRLVAGLTAAVTTALTLTAVSTTTAGAAGAPQVYVAMGDSFSAGSVVLPLSDPFVCARSSANYAGLLAQQIKPAAFRDVTCGSATTAHFSTVQPGNVYGSAAPQYDALSKDTTIVTVGIGGNDIGLVGLATSCVNLLPETGLLTLPLLGQSCKDTYTAGGVDQIAAKIDAFAPTYGTVIREIRKRSPKAKILMVGYPTAIKPGGCYPFVPVLPQDADYLQASLDRLNLRMKQQSAANGATYVDLRTPSIGHDMCQGIGVKWMEGLIPLGITNGFAPLHPNAAGYINAVPTIRAALG